MAPVSATDDGEGDEDSANLIMQIMEMRSSSTGTAWLAEKMFILCIAGFLIAFANFLPYPTATVQQIKLGILAAGVIGFILW